MTDLSELLERVLVKLDDRALDIYDLAASLGIDPQTTFVVCRKLKKLGLVEWMYSDDEVCLSKDGRLELQARGEAP